MKILDPQYGEHFVGRDYEIQELKVKIRNNCIVVLTGDRGIGKTNLMKVLEKFFEKEKECHYIEYGSLFSEEISRIFLPEQTTTGFSSSISMLGIGGGAGKSWKPREPHILEYMEKSEKLIFIENAHELKKGEIETILTATHRNNKLRFVLEIATPHMPDVELRVDSEQIVELKKLNNQDIEKIVTKKFSNFSGNVVKQIIYSSNGYPYIARTLAYVCDKKTVEDEMLEFLETLRDKDIKYELDRIHKEVLETLEKEGQDIIKKLALAPPILTLKLIVAFCSEGIDTALRDIFERGILIPEKEPFCIYHPLFRDYLTKIQPIAVGKKGEIYCKAMKNIKSEFDTIYLLIEMINEPHIFKDLIKIVKNFDAINALIIQSITWGELKQAVIACSYLKKSNDKKWESIAIGNMGGIYQIKGELDKALEHYKKSLDLDIKQGCKIGIASNYGNIGNIYRIQGELDKAIEYYERALRLNEELMRKKGIAIQLQNMGNVYYLQGKYDKALDHFEKALEFNEQLENIEGVAGNYGSIGNIFFSKDEFEKALEYYGIALIMNEELGNKEGVANQLGGMGNIYFMKGELDKALYYLEKALILNLEVGDKKGSATQYGNMGLIYQRKEEFEKALEYYGTALTIFKEFGGKIEMSRTLAKIGSTFVEKGEKEKALDYYFDAQELADNSPPLLNEINSRINKLLEIK